MIPLTSTQVHQPSAYVGGTFDISMPMSRSEKQRAREYLGPRATFYERPQDGIDLTLIMERARGKADKKVTPYFDQEDLPIGVHIEQSLVAVAPLPDRRDRK